MGSRFDRIFKERVIPILNREFGVLVRLSRGVYITEEFTARRSDSKHDAVGAEYGIEVKILMRDYLLPVAGVAIDGDEIEPQTGDRITEGDECFEIQPPDENTPSVEPQPGGNEWLVHTKRIT